VSLGRRALAEFIGTALLLAAIVGSGIAASRLSPDNTGLQLFENAAATGAALVAIILAIGPVSGAHINPVMTLANLTFRGIDTIAAITYMAVQFAGAALGSSVANLMFSLPAVTISTTARSGGGLWLAEGIATFGLVLVVFGVARSGRASVAPFAVGAYIMSAFFFTSSTSFANPAVTVARMLSNTFAGIAPSSGAAFVASQLVGAALGLGVVRFLYPEAEQIAPRIVVPRRESDDSPVEA
jgi:glycerol uptake facilitator-like aquaporin